MASFSRWREASRRGWKTGLARSTTPMTILASGGGISTEVQHRKVDSRPETARGLFIAIAAGSTASDNGRIEPEGKSDDSDRPGNRGADSWKR